MFVQKKCPDSASDQILSESVIEGKVMVYLTCFLSWRQQDRKSSTGGHFSGVSPLRSSHSLQIAHITSPRWPQNNILLCIGALSLSLGLYSQNFLSHGHTGKLCLSCWARLRSPLCEPSTASHSVSTVPGHFLRR